MSRKAFVAVLGVAVTQGVGLLARTAAANPPAPSSVPDPTTFQMPKTGERANRIKRTDGGCWLHYPSGAASKTECPAVMDKPGEQLERELETGQCVLFEPWADEPKETPCPAILVPEGFKTPPPPASALAPAKPSAVTPTEPAPAQKTSCGSCTVGASTSALDEAASGDALALVGLVAFARRRRR